MNEIKLNATEIKKALGCCTRPGCSDNQTKDCPLKSFEDCSTILAKNVLDLINNNETEYKKLKAEMGVSHIIGNICVRTKTLDHYNKFKNLIKAEAYKEIAKEIKDKIKKYYAEQDQYKPEGSAVCDYLAYLSCDIDRFLKEKGIG